MLWDCLLERGVPAPHCNGRKAVRAAMAKWPITRPVGTRTRLSASEILTVSRLGTFLYVLSLGGSTVIEIGAGVNAAMGCCLPLRLKAQKPIPTKAASTTAPTISQNVIFDPPNP